ncbi:hypothetical protein AB0K00_06100 [Dactylosporangium sp. NPDC049525]|uniref:hypothetical protein n=1 Tax=Dactylosporangium sp. NPDC049525 TaxID=3154730 RepID=UPI003416CEEB
MRRLALSTLLATLLGVAVAGCEKEAAETPAAQSSAAQQPTTPPSSGQSPAGDAYPNSEKGANALLKALPEDPQLALRLKPTTEDYKALFVGDAAAKAEQFYATSLWNDPANLKIDTGAAKTELLLFHATSEEIRSWSTTVQANFPGGYQQVGPHLKPGLTWFRWRYVKPGESSGVAYDGLVNVNGHWVWTPKLWKALEG